MPLFYTALTLEDGQDRDSLKIGCDADKCQTRDIACTQLNMPDKSTRNALTSIVLLASAYTTMTRVI